MTFVAKTLDNKTRLMVVVLQVAGGLLHHRHQHTHIHTHTHSTRREILHRTVTVAGSTSNKALTGTCCWWCCCVSLPSKPCGSAACLGRGDTQFMMAPCGWCARGCSVLRGQGGHVCKHTLTVLPAMLTQLRQQLQQQPGWASTHKDTAMLQQMMRGRR